MLARPMTFCLFVFLLCACTQVPLGLDVDLPDSGRNGKFVAWAVRSIEAFDPSKGTIAVRGAVAPSGARMVVEVIEGDVAKLNEFSVFGVGFATLNEAITVSIPIGSKSPIATLIPIGFEESLASRPAMRDLPAGSAGVPLAFEVTIHGGAGRRIRVSRFNPPGFVTIKESVDGDSVTIRLTVAAFRIAEAPDAKLLVPLIVSKQ